LEEVDPRWRQHFAVVLGLCRTGLYRKPTKQKAKDIPMVNELRLAHDENRFYGVFRLAIHLGWSQSKTRRIRNLAGITIVRPTKKHRTEKLLPEIDAPNNALQSYAKLRQKDKPQYGVSYSDMTESGGWVQDFTYLFFEHSWHYLAVVLDLKTRQVVGWRLGTRHTSELTHAAVLDALSKYPSPTILHSDRGSEYLSYRHQLLCDKMEITLSCSKPASPWQNGFMERFFGTIKPEIGKLSQYKNIAELHEAIALAIYYYNHKRIHTALKMSPAAYAATLTNQQFERDKVLQKIGG